MTDSDEEVTRFCPYCEQTFEGENGILRHLDQVTGHPNHPEDSTETHTAADFPRVEVDNQGTVRRVLDEIDDAGIVDTEKGTAVHVSRLYHFIAERIVADDRSTAHRMRRDLLGVESVEKPLSWASPHPEVLKALVGHGYTDDPSERVRATLEQDGIRVACRGACALYSADEARTLAGYVEPIAKEEGWHGEMMEFVEFLRYGAAVLDQAKPDQHLHEEFRDWRDS